MIAAAHGAVAAELGLPVVAVASRSGDRARDLAAVLSAKAVGYHELPAGAELVVVATPPQCHAADAIRLLDDGVAVILEKPLCRTLDEADRLVAAAARHHGRLLYAENLAYAPVVQRLVSMVPDVGHLTHVEVRALQGLPTWGDFTSDEWGGGALFDLGVHPVAVALLIANAAGLGRPRAVSAHLRGGADHASDEHAEVRLHHRGGLVSHVTASWDAGPGQVWDAQVAGEKGVVRAELQPAIALEHNGNPIRLPDPRGRARANTVAALTDLGYAGQMTAMVAALRSGHEPAMSAAFGREVLQVVMAAYSSAARDGVQVALPFTGPRDLTPLQLWRRR